jgi:hypothetical protein
MIRYGRYYGDGSGSEGGGAWSGNQIVKVLEIRLLTVYWTDMLAMGGRGSLRRI